MEFLKELNEMNQVKKYEIHFSNEAPSYNTPHYFDIPDSQTDEISFTANQCDQLTDVAKSYWMGEHQHHRAKDMHALGIVVTDVKVKEVNFDVDTLIDNLRDYMDMSGDDGDGFDNDDEDDNDSERSPQEVIQSYGDCFGSMSSGSATMPYDMTFVVTVSKPLTKDAAHWLADDISGAVWGQYNDDGGGFRDFEMTEVK